MTTKPPPEGRGLRMVLKSRRCCGDYSNLADEAGMSVGLQSAKRERKSVWVHSSE